MSNHEITAAGPASSSIRDKEHNELHQVPYHHMKNESQPGLPIYHRPRANPAPLGLFSFASTTLLLSFINVQTRHVIEPNMVVGMAFAVGGAAQFFAGIAEFVVGNTFGMTAFCSYGAFWISIGLMFWPSSGILVAYETGLTDALGLFMITWFVFTFILFFATFRSSAGLVSLFGLLSVTFLILAIGYFQGDNKTTIKVAGYFGIFTALNAYYVGAGSLLTAESAPFSLPNPSLARG